MKDNVFELDINYNTKFTDIQLWQVIYIAKVNLKETKKLVNCTQTSYSFRSFFRYLKRFAFRVSDLPKFITAF